MGNNSIFGAMAAATQGMNAQSTRLKIVSENLSNADTHGYHRKLITFQNTYDNQAKMNVLSIGDITLDQTKGDVEFNPAHPLSNAQGYVELSNVNMMVEMADARQASRSYEANLTTFKQARNMYSGLLDLLRR
ncbi:MAG: flagellar basal body rod protein FlgC [Robiginitomaculum sp.]|nr:flagellar basal body rod protein FlgC [Robiginitomaculum sp.]